MVWNVQKSGFEKISEWNSVRACVKTSKNSNVCILTITQPIELKFDMEVKPKYILFFNIIFVATDYRIEILWRFEFLEKCLQILAAANFKRSS